MRVFRPFVTGELASGNLHNRNGVLCFVGETCLFGIGIGSIDAHLLAAVFLTSGSVLWTRDKRLLVASSRLGIAANTRH